MPKDWLRYKAEVHRLYIVEEKTVYQVREILREKYGFNASVRAYRMHFDEWGMKKYKSTKSRSNTASSRHPSSPPTSSISNTPTISSVSATPPMVYGSEINMGDYRTESEPLPQSRHLEPAGGSLSILGRIHFEASDPLQTLDILFNSWQHGPEFVTTLTTYFRDPKFNKWVPRYQGHETPAIFELIERWVPEKDRFRLTKGLLEADLQTRSHRLNYSNPWQELWYQACDAAEWEDAREILYDGGELSLTPGVFQSCALVVLAERLLERDMFELDRWLGRTLSEEEEDRKKEYIMRCRSILGFFAHRTENVNPAFYKTLLSFELDGNTAETAINRPCDNDLRLQYLQLSAVSTISKWEFTDSRQMPHSSVSPQVPTTHQLPPTPPTATDSKLHEQLPHFSTTSSLGLLKNRWHFLDGFEEYLRTTLFPYDGSQIFIFSPSQPTSENLLDAMIRVIPSKDEQLSLTKAILITSCSPNSYPSHISFNLLNWWRNLYAFDRVITYEEFFGHLVNNSSLVTSLEHTIATVEGRKLFMDATISLVAERVLGSMKSTLRRKRESNPRSVEKRNKYWSVLQVLRGRGFTVDEFWTKLIVESM